MSRKALLPTFLAVCLVVGCGQTPDRQVAFSVDGHSARTGPIQDCDIALTTCDHHKSAVAVLGVPVGQPVQISVPDSVAQTPWQVVFRYHKNGQQIGGRSEVFAPGARKDYTLHVPDEGTLESLEVQQYGAPELTGGEQTFRIRAAWVLDNKEH
ncbi:MAG: DUF2771 family protein [Pseudonocardiaceae bacterium]